MTTFDCPKCNHKQTRYGNCEECGWYVGNRNKKKSEPVHGHYNPELENFEISCNKIVFDRREH